jgi:hypothetical protein
MMDDLVKRLRYRRAYWIGAGMEPDPLCHEAAAALEAKDEEIARLQGALDSKGIMDLLDDLGAANSDIAALRTALHDAINAPKGVVPASAEPFYSPARAALQGWG